MNVCGITCDKASFSCTVVTGDETVDHDVSLPPGRQADRPGALSWLLEEAQRFFENNAVSEVRVWVAQGGGKFAASPERYEVETCIKIASHRVRASLWCMNKEKVRAAYGVPKGQGAFETLLERPDVKARSNKDRRNQYLMARAPAR